MNVQKHKMGQVIFSHRCTHVVIQSSQSACASFAFARCDWNSAGNLRRMLIFGKRAASQSLISTAGEAGLNCGSIANIDFSIA